MSAVPSAATPRAPSALENWFRPFRERIVRGRDRAPFLAAPDASGRRMAFGVAWTLASGDTAGGILARAAGSRGHFAVEDPAPRGEHAPTREDTPGSR